MLIGVSGKIGSGKDTFGKMLEYLHHKHLNKIPLISVTEFLDSYDDVYTNEDYNNTNGLFTIKKFADKLKDVVCLLINCSRKELENHEFKNKPLGEDWIHYRYADGFTKDHNGNTSMLSKSCSKDKYEEEFKINWSTAYKTVLTPRILLQLLGTECGRQIIHPNIWINSLMSTYKESYKNNRYYANKNVFNVSEEDEVNNPAMYPNWIVTDLRFPNEYDAIKDNGGITVRITRNNSAESQSTHESETALDNYKTHDYEITNDGSLHDLYLSANTFYVTFINTKYND